MKTATTYEDRIALIKEIAERKKKMAKIKAKSKTVVRRAPKVKRSFMDVPNEDASKNPNYYTDASKYAKEYYGETFYQTTRYDNDWD
jgi:hypothetical protein